MRDTIRDFWTGSSLHREYWASQGSNPQAGFQTVWVQRHIQQENARRAALRAQYINPTEITG